MRSAVVRSTQSLGWGVVLCTIFATVSIALATQTSSAQAAWGCPAGVFCAFPKENGDGNLYQWALSNSNWHEWAIADDDDSWSNMSTVYNVRVFNDVRFGGGCEIRIDKGVSKGSAFPWENDDGSSHQRESQTEAC
jgi:hypothetical protein